MGNLTSRVRALFRTSPSKVLLLGLDAAGKTTIVYQLRRDHSQPACLIGGSFETVQFNHMDFTAWDVSETTRHSLWRLWFDHDRSEALVFVLDASDPGRFERARAQLARALAEESMHDACVLVLCNKQDLPCAVEPEAISALLRLADVCGGADGRRRWRVQGCSATHRTGLMEGLAWLENELHAKREQGWG